MPDLLSLLPAAQRAKSVPALVNVWSRARRRAALWSRLLADWPGDAIAEFARRDAQAIEAIFYRKGSKP